MSEKTDKPLVFPCAMSGERETLIVDAVGAYAVSFKCGPEASVIVRGNDLVRLRAVLDRQIASWQWAKA